MISSIREDLQKIARHLRKEGGWILVGRLYLLGAALITSIALARLMSPQEYGVYKYITAVVAISAVLSLPEAFQTVLRYAGQGYERAYPLLARQRAIYSIAGTLALLGLAYHESKSSLELGVSLAAVAIIYPLYFATQVYDPFLQAKGRLKDLNRIYINRATVQLTSIVGFYALFKSIYIATVLSLAMGAIQNAWTYRRVKNLYQEEINRPNNEPPPSYRRETLILSAIGVLPVLVEHLDKVIIGRFIDYGALAVFSLGITLGKTVNTFFKAFITSINAKLVHRELSRRHYVMVLLVGTAIGFLLAALTPPIATALYGERYTQSARYAAVILQSLGLYAAHTLYYNQNMFYKGRSLRSMYINNITVPGALLIYIFALCLVAPSIDHFLLLLACIYPFRLILSATVLFASRRIIRN